MTDFAVLRERGPFTRASQTSAITGSTDEFFAVTRHAELNEISRRPQDFCSGQGTTSIADLPAEALEFFGSFIAMDDPRHARQRGIVARGFTPRRLQGLLDSVDTICTEVIDAMCEDGEADLVTAISQPFPLLVICDLMGIPRSEFDTVLRATNVILGGGDPEMLGDATDAVTAILEAGVELTALMGDLAISRRADPRDDLTSALVHAGLDEDLLTSDEIASFFILLAVAGNDTTRTAISLGAHLLSEHPDQRRTWTEDFNTTATAIEEIVRYASPVTFMRRTVTHDLTLSDHDFSEGDKVILFYGAANRDPRAFDDPERFDIRRNPNPHVGFGGPGPHFCLGAHLARRELAVVFRQLLTRFPDLKVTGEPVPLHTHGVPLIGGIKHLPVAYAPQRPSVA